jgi:1,4-alpha-glucan branching enzyme
MIKKQYLTNRPVCKVTFSLEPGTDTKTAYVVGDFNDWQATPMQQLKDGRFKAVLELDKDHRYEFRYLVNEAEWINEEEADDYVPNPFASQNSVVAV